MSDEEYEVESLLKARAHKKGGKITWKFLVKWKGYDDKDNTWEPLESFEGSADEIVTKFWERVNVGDRNINDASQFRNLEEIFPTGPPRRKKSVRKEKSPSQEKQQSRSHKRRTERAKPKNEVRNEDNDNDEPISQRTRRSSGRNQILSNDEEDEPQPKRLSRKRSRPSTEEEAPPSKRSRSEKSLSKVAPRRKGKRVIDEEKNDSEEHPTIPVASDSEDELGLSATVAKLPETSDAAPVSEQTTQPGDSTTSIPIDDPENPMRPNADDNHFGADEDGEGDDDDGIALPSSPQPARFASAKFPATEPRATAQARNGIQPKPPQSAVPAHRQRAANPRIKITQEPELLGSLDGAITAKAKLLHRDNASVPMTPPSAGSSRHDVTKIGPPRRVPGSKTGTGRSSKGLTDRPASLLTASKGKLTTLKRGSRKEGEAEDERDASEVVEHLNSGGDARDESAVMDAGPQTSASDVTMHVDLLPSSALPSGDELLQLAGLKQNDENALPDFVEEEVLNTLVQATADEAQEEMLQAAPASTSANPPKSIFDGILRNETIFGPLTSSLSSFLNTDAGTTNESPITPTYAPYSLNLDPAASIPIMLKDVKPATKLDSLSLEMIAVPGPKGPPGKLYKVNAAESLLKTLETGGSSARVVLNEEADSEQQQLFAKFCSLLNEGGLFVAMVGTDLLAYCASINVELGEKLGVPTALLGLSDTVIASHVKIVNHSAFADAADLADIVRW